MKKLFLSAIAVVLAGGAYAIPNTFSEGDVLSAEKMNENFQHLEQQFQGALAKTVNCAAGETINEAIENGYNDITVSGTCNENLLYTVWRDSGVDNKPSGMPVPRYLKITGADSTAKIVDTTSNTENTISVNSGATVVLENITISGGKFGVAATRNSNLLMTGGVTIEGFTENGIRVDDSSYLGINDGGVTITGGTGAVRGIYIGTGSSGWVASATMTGVERGFDLFANATVVSGGYSISASKRGIRMNNGHFFQYGGAGVIESTSEYAVDAYQSTFDIWNPSTLEVKNLVGGRGISLNESRSSLNNLKMPDFDSTGSGWNPALQLSGGSSAYINGAEISGSTDDALVSISDGSITRIENSTLTVGSASNAIDAYGSTRLVLRNSNISGSVTDNLVNIDQGSTAQIRNSSSISGSVGGALVSTSHGSSSDIRDSTFTLNSGNRALAVKDSSNLEMWNSTLSGTATEELVDVRRLSNAIIRNESKLSQSGSDSPDVRVSNLSFLSVWSDSSINSVDCHMKGTVSADEGTVTTLSSSCTE